MAVLRNFRQTPPDGWRYTQMETQARFTGMSLTEIADVVIAHRVFKGLTPTDKPTVELEIQRQICSCGEPHVCIAENGEDWKPIVDQSRSLDPDKVVEFSRAAYRFVESRAEMVPKSESERRAAICRGCPYNRPTVCVCTPLFKLLDALVPAARREAGLAICNVCGCSLTVKVLLPMSTIHGENSESKIRLPSHCWMNPNGQEEKAT